MDVGADDTHGGCTGENVCKNGSCVAPCKSGVACSESLGPCRKGVTSCPSLTSAPVCMDAGIDDARGGCTAGNICKNGACVAGPCTPKSAGNLVVNPGFDTLAWPAIDAESAGNWNSVDAMGCPSSGSLQVGVGSSARECISFGSAGTIYLGYMVNRSGTFGQLGCGVDTWYTDTACTNAWDLGTEFLESFNVTGWQTLSMSFPAPSQARSFVLSCHLVNANATVLFDRIYVRTTPGAF
jgi:hypothetical protein